MTTKKAKDDHLDELLKKAKEDDAKKHKKHGAEEEIEKYKDQAIRAMADLKNVKRRAEEERLEFAKYAGAGLLEKFLPFFDDMQRAFSHLPKDLEKDAWVDGLKKVNVNFWKILKTEGFEEIQPKAGDDFNIDYHESVMQDANAKPGKIAQCFEPGYKYKDKVLRAAKVSVGV